MGSLLLPDPWFIRKVLKMRFHFLQGYPEGRRNTLEEYDSPLGVVKMIPRLHGWCFLPRQALFRVPECIACRGMVH